jgi:hypothetical protein
MRRRYFGIRTALAIPLVIVILVPSASSAALLDQMQAAIRPTTFPALGQEIARARTRRAAHVRRTGFRSTSRRRGARRRNFIVIRRRRFNPASERSERRISIFAKRAAGNIPGARENLFRARRRGGAPAFPRIISHPRRRHRPRRPPRALNGWRPPQRLRNFRLLHPPIRRRPFLPQRPPPSSS